MKDTFPPRNAAFLLLIAVMLLGLAGCGSADDSAPQGSVPAQSGTSSESSQPVQSGVPADSNGAKTLAQLRAEAQREVEGSTFAAAYLGQEDLEGIGISPTDNATIANYAIFEDIDAAHRIDISGGAEDAEVYCILPVDPKNGMFVSIVDEETDTVQEEVYRSETGEPILLRCNGGGILNAKVCFTENSQVEEFWPMTDVYYGEKYLSGPNGGNYYDFTVYPNWKEEASAYLPAGNWRAEVLQPLQNFQPITLALYLWREDSSAELVISDSQSGDVMADYRGTWALQDDESLALDMACAENCTGMKEYDVPIKGSYGCSIGVDGSLTISVSGEGSTPFYVNHAYEPITFYPEMSGTQPSDYGYELCVTVLNWYETTTGYRPEYAVVECVENDELLIRLYDDMGTHVLTDGWYLINPDTLQGTDYITEEAIDFSDFTNGVG